MLDIKMKHAKGDSNRGASAFVDSYTYYVNENAGYKLYFEVYFGDSTSYNDRCVQYTPATMSDLTREIFAQIVAYRAQFLAGLITE